MRRGNIEVTIGTRENKQLGLTNKSAQMRKFTELRKHEDFSTSLKTSAWWKVGYRKLLLEAVNNLREEEDKYQEDVAQLKTRIREVENHMQEQFNKVRIALNYMYEEDKTILTESINTTKISSSISQSVSSAPTITESSSSTSKTFTTPSLVPHKADKIMNQLITTLIDLPRSERIVLTKRLIRTLKKLRANKNQADEDHPLKTLGQQQPKIYLSLEQQKETNIEAKETTCTPTKMEKKIDAIEQEETQKQLETAKEKPLQLANGEIGIPQDIELTTKDSLVTAQIFDDIKASNHSTSLMTPIGTEDVTATAVSISNISTASGMLSKNLSELAHRPSDTTSVHTLSNSSTVNM